MTLKTLRFTGNLATDRHNKRNSLDYHEVKLGNKSAFITKGQFDFLFRLALYKIKGEPLVIKSSKRTRMIVHHLREKLDHFGFPKYLIRSGLRGRWTLGIERKNIKFDKSILKVTLNDELFDLMEEIL